MAKGLTEALRVAWKRGTLKKTVEECGMMGSQSIYVVKEVAKILEGDEDYCNRLFSATSDAIKPALLIEELTDENMTDAHAKALSVLRGLAPSFYVMGMMVGYVAARQEIEDAAKNIKDCADEEEAAK